MSACNRNTHTRRSVCNSNDDTGTHRHAHTDQHVAPGIATVTRTQEHMFVAGIPTQGTVYLFIYI